MIGSENYKKYLKNISKKIFDLFSLQTYDIKKKKYVQKWVCFNFIFKNFGLRHLYQNFFSDFSFFQYLFSKYFKKCKPQSNPHQNTNENPQIKKVRM